MDCWVGDVGFGTAGAFIVRPLFTLGHMLNGDAVLVIGAKVAAFFGEAVRDGPLGDWIVEAGAD